MFCICSVKLIFILIKPKHLEIIYTKVPTSISILSAEVKCNSQLLRVLDIIMYKSTAEKRQIFPANNSHYSVLNPVQISKDNIKKRVQSGHHISF